ncbi:MAG: caleosin family protein [Polyangiaceae bacterium]
MADGGTGARRDYTALQRHVAYFDGDDDGLVGWRETYRGIRALGAGVGWSASLAAIIVLALGKLTGGGWTTVRVANIHRGKHPSDTGVFDAAGELILPRFQALFASVAQSSAADRISFAEFRAFMKLGPQSALGSFFSWAEAKLFFCVAADCTKRQGAGDVPAIRERTLLRFYRGELVPRIARLRKLRAERAARRGDAGRDRSQSKN